MKTDSQLQKDVMDEIRWEPSTNAAQKIRHSAAGANVSATSRYHTRSSTGSNTTGMTYHTTG